jgi:fumarylpyruvate hydrolase
MNNRREFFQVTALGAAGIALFSQAEAAGSGYAVHPEAIPSLPVVGSAARFPVRRIYCMGLNYPAHVDEGKGGFKVPPFYFQKSADMIVQNNAKVDYPLLTKDYEYELELVVALKSGGKNIAKEQALDCVYGYAVGLDMTRRDLQGDGMSKKMPWEPGKSFDQSAPCSAITPASKVGHLSKARIQLKVNDQVHQDDDISAMIYDVPSIIAFLSKSVALAAGDIIYTGTPAGSGPVVSGDRMVGTIEQLGALTITVA